MDVDRFRRGQRPKGKKLCRELGAIDFGWLIAQKVLVLGLEAHRPALVGSQEINVTGYILYQRVPLAGVARQTAWI